VRRSTCRSAARRRGADHAVRGRSTPGQDQPSRPPATLRVSFDVLLAWLMRPRRERRTVGRTLGAVKPSAAAAESRARCRVRRCSSTRDASSATDAFEPFLKAARRPLCSTIRSSMRRPPSQSTPLWPAIPFPTRHVYNTGGPTVPNKGGPTARNECLAQLLAQVRGLFWHRFSK
jgi:hypothetical protein